MHTEAAIQECFDRYLKVAGDAQAAATLVLAHVTREAASGPADNLTVKQAAQRLGVSKETIYQLCSDGVLRHQKVGRAIRIAPADLEDYRQVASQAPTNQPLRCLSL